MGGGWGGSAECGVPVGLSLERNVSIPILCDSFSPQGLGTKSHENTGSAACRRYDMELEMNGKTCNDYKHTNNKYTRNIQKDEREKEYDEKNTFVEMWHLSVCQ